MFNFQISRKVLGFLLVAAEIFGLRLTNACFSFLLFFVVFLVFVFFVSKVQNELGILLFHKNYKVLGAYTASLFKILVAHKEILGASGNRLPIRQQFYCVHISMTQGHPTRI